MYGRDFSSKTIKKLSKMGITIVGKQALPTNGYSDVAYILNDNGTQKLRTFSDIVKM
jgi:hypothetical protein